MILPSAEALLMATAAGLYLYDSALLTCYNEGIFSAVGRAGWSLRFGSANYHFAGREIFLPNPLLPHRPTYRLAWRLEGAVEGEAKGSTQDDGWTAQRAALRPLAPCVWGIAGGLFFALPLGLFTRLGEPALIAALVLTYASILAALVMLWQYRRSLVPSRRRFAALAFESLACPPFALNLVRRISRETPVSEDLVAAARRLLPPDAWQAVRSELVARIDQEIVFADTDPRRRAGLEQGRASLLRGKG